MPLNEKTPTVSVVAVSYNHERWIAEALDSIQRQTLTDFELIYADDASQDRSVEVALDWISRHGIPAKTILHERNRGLCQTLNEAVAQCTGRYVQLMSCDDVLLADKLERHAAILDAAGGDVSLVHSPVHQIDADGRPLAVPMSNGSEKEPPLTDSPFERMLDANPIWAPSVLMRRDALRAAGGYDERLRYEDWDMWLRLARRSRFAFSQPASVAYRVLPNGLHTTIDETDEYWIFRKHIDHPLARARLNWTAYAVYESGRMSAEMRDDFLDVIRAHPEMWNFRNALIRMRVSPPMCKSLARFKARASQLSGRKRRTLAAEAC